MRRTHRLWAALLAAVLLLAACGGGERTRPDYMLYFLPAGEKLQGSALDWEPYSGGEDPSPEDLLAALLAGPTQEGLTSPFPRGVALRSWAWDEEEPGVLRIGLSEQYGALADISLTLADSCIVLTLSQLEGWRGWRSAPGDTAPATEATRPSGPARSCCGTTWRFGGSWAERMPLDKIPLSL